MVRTVKKTRGLTNNPGDLPKKISNLVHDRRFKPAARLLWAELVFGGQATMAELMDRTGWTRPTLGGHLAALVRQKVVNAVSKGHARLYEARIRPRVVHWLDQNRVTRLLKSLRHPRLTPNQRLVLIHLCLYARHYIPVNDRAKQLGISKAGYEESRRGLRAEGIADHNHGYNAPLALDEHSEFLGIPIRATKVDSDFKELAEILWEANRRTGSPHEWWWQAFRHLAESEGRSLSDLADVVFYYAQETKSFPRIHDPFTVVRYVPLVRRLLAHRNSQLSSTSR